jgi:hypothetical protein
VSLPSLELGPPTPSLPTEFVSPPGHGGGGVGGQNSLAGEGVGGPNLDDRPESLALCILCGSFYQDLLFYSSDMGPDSNCRESLLKLSILGPILHC